MDGYRLSRNFLRFHKIFNDKIFEKNNGARYRHEIARTKFEKRKKKETISTSSSKVNNFLVSFADCFARDEGFSRARTFISLKNGVQERKGGEKIGSVFILRCVSNSFAWNEGVENNYRMVDKGAPVETYRLLSLSRRERAKDKIETMHASLSRC